MKVGIVGLGRAGQRHATNAAAMGHDVRTYELINDERWARTEVLTNADAVVIASPSECHLQDLRDCIAARKPVLVEKPIALVGQARDVEDLLTEENLPPIAVGYNLRFHPDIVHIKQSLADKPPYYASLWCCQATDSQGPLTNGCINDWACHEIDLALHLIGPLRLIDKHVDRFTADLGLRTWEGTHCHVHIHSDMRYQGNVRGGLIVSETYSWQYDLVATPVTNAHYLTELAAFLHWVETGERPSALATSENGLLALQLCERAAK